MKAATRTLSFFVQWAAEVWRQPWLMAVLVLGPFLILFLFGYGEVVGAPPPRAIVVTPPGQSTSNPLAILPQQLGAFVKVVQVTGDKSAAEQALRSGQTDLVIVLPPDPSSAIQQGQHVPIQVLTNEIDPVRLSYAQAYISQQVDALNRQTVQKAISQAQSQVGDVGGELQQADQYLKLLQSGPDLSQMSTDLNQLQSSLDQLSTTLHQALAIANATPLFSIGVLSQPVGQLQTAIKSVDNLRQQLTQIRSQLGNSNVKLPSPQQLQQMQGELDSVSQTAKQLQQTPADVIAAPFTLDLQNIAPWKPNGTGFYAPSVLVLILQHLGITLGALALSRVRLLGVINMLKVSPATAVEITTGNYLSYGSLTAIAGGALFALIVGALGVPVFGPPAALAAALILLILASVGIGLTVALVSRTEQQAAQVAMLILIASVFFSGFLVSLDTIRWPVRIVSYLLPATYAIRTVDNVMLRGTLLYGWDLAVLGAFAVFFFGLTVWLFKRELSPA